MKCGSLEGDVFCMPHMLSSSLSFSVSSSRVRHLCSRSDLSLCRIWFSCKRPMLLLFLSPPPYSSAIGTSSPIFRFANFPRNDLSFTVLSPNLHYLVHSYNSLISCSSVWLLLSYQLRSSHSLSGRALLP